MNWLSDDPEDAAEHFTAQAFLHYQLASRGLTLPDLQIRPHVVATFQPFIYAHLVRLCGAEATDRAGLLNQIELARGRQREREVTVIRLPVGAPAAVTFLEVLATAGARNVVAVGAAGSLQERAPVGAAVLPTSAIREEGTSYHYRPPGVAAVPDEAAVAALRVACGERDIIAHEGQVWTTDAPFRELTSKVRRFAAAGVLAVDMEASALYIVGAMRGLRVASLFIISDELFHPWRPAFFDRTYREAAAQIAACALDGLVSLPES